MGGPSKLKCQVCRDHKKKCEPEDRRWDEDGGVQEKCMLCKTGDYPCDAGSKCPKPVRMSSPLKRRKSTTQQMEGSELEPKNDGDMYYGLGGSVDNKLEKRRRLKEKTKCLDHYDEIFMQCCNTITYLENTKARLLPHHPYENSNDTFDMLEVSRAQSAAREQLLVTLAEVRLLAANVAEDGDLDSAECAYSRAAKVFASHPLNTNAVYMDLLREVGSFYLKNGDYRQAEKHFQEIFNLPHLSEAVEADTLQLLTQSIEASTEQIGKAFRSGELGRVKPSVQDPFPQSHRLMAAVPATASRTLAAATTFEWKTLDITGSPLIHSAILSRNAHVIDMIRYCPHKELLERRDIYKRTALFLAALSQAEDVGSAIMNRFAGEPAVTRGRLMNDRDTLGNTILAISILSKCSTSFIKAIIDNGSEADPNQVEDGYTPLQAAALMGRLDVFEILQDHGAKDREPQLGKPNALQLAQSGKHYTIIERLSQPS